MVEFLLVLIALLLFFGLYRFVSDTTAEISRVSKPAPLKIGRTLALSLHYCGKNISQIIGLLAQWLLVYLGLAFLLTRVGILIFKSDIEMLSSIGQALLTGSLDTISISYIVSFAPVAVTVHRGIILKEPVAAAKYFPSFLENRVWRFLGITLLVYLVPIIAGVIGSGIVLITEGTSSFDEVLAPLGEMAVAVIVFGFVFVLPAVATDEYRSLAHCRQLIHGSFWRLLLALQIALIPAYVIAIFLVFNPDSDVLWRFVSLNVFVVPFAILAVAVLSHAYQSATADVRDLKASD